MGLFGKSKKEPVPKNLETGEGYAVKYDGENIRVLWLDDENYDKEDDLFADLDEHLSAGFKIITTPWIRSGHVYDPEKFIILSKPGKTGLTG